MLATEVLVMCSFLFFKSSASSIHLAYCSQPPVSHHYLYRRLVFGSNGFEQPKTTASVLLHSASASGSLGSGRQHHQQQVIIMLQLQAAAGSERRAAGGLWVPGALMEAGSARAQEIARRREEMMGMLRDLPESEYELSLTDLVEKANAEAAAPTSEGKEPGSSASGRLAGTGKPERRGSARRRDGGSGSSFRSSSDGVLLNFYMPRSLTRSFTAPRPGRTPSVASDCNKRERDADAYTVKCWSLLWDRPWRKSSRRDPAAPPNDNVRAAILKAAKHSTSPAKP